MKFFGKNESKNTEEEIADTIMQQEDRLGILSSVIGRLPKGLVFYFLEVQKAKIQTRSYVEVDLQAEINMYIDILPADLLVKQYRDPKAGDIVVTYLHGENGYFEKVLKITKINLKDGTASVHDLLEPDRKANVSINSITCVVNVVKYKDPEWVNIVQNLGIEYDIHEMRDWVMEDIDYVKNNDFYDKESSLIKLEERLKRLEEAFITPATAIK